MSYEDVGKAIVPKQQQDPAQQQSQPSQQDDPYYGYYDPTGGQYTRGLNEKMFQMVIKADLPDDIEQYEGFFQSLIDAASANPNVTAETLRRWNRRFKDVDDRAHSEGMSTYAAAKARQLLFEIRSFIARGDNPLQGITGVSAAITSRQQSESTLKMPQQQEQQGGAYGFRWPFGRR